MKQEQKPNVIESSEYVLEGNYLKLKEKKQDGHEQTNTNVKDEQSPIETGTHEVSEMDNNPIQDVTNVPDVTVNEISTQNEPEEPQKADVNPKVEISEQERVAKLTGLVDQADNTMKALCYARDTDNHKTFMIQHDKLIQVMTQMKGYCMHDAKYQELRKIYGDWYKEERLKLFLAECTGMQTESKDSSNSNKSQQSCNGAFSSPNPLPFQEPQTRMTREMKEALDNLELFQGVMLNFIQYKNWDMLKRSEPYYVGMCEAIKKLCESDDQFETLMTPYRHWWRVNNLDKYLN